MKKVHIMSYRIYIYVFMLFATSFALSGINFNHLFKEKHIIEAKIFILLIDLGLSYIASQFIINFIEFV